jgi:diguanylate cyclase (GGDEF)-like protein
MSATGLPEELLTTPSIRLRDALWHDHHGDTESCLLVLSDIAADLERQSRSGAIERVRPAARAAYAYAVARLRALGEPPGPDSGPLLAHGTKELRMRELAALSDVCLAIGEGRPGEALATLDSLPVSPETLGPAELPRLRALAHLTAGDHRAAYEADRRAFRRASEHENKLREAFVEGTAARLRHEDLRKRAKRSAGEALTDTLTGLPNRRYLEQYVAAMVERGEHAVVGVCDMDGFKAVNTVHGHLAGDLVLQRAAEIIQGVLRRNDFLARYGGDEFVVVLPRTCLTEAAEVARRVVAAVRAANWSEIVPGTPVSVSIGWAEVAGPRMELRRVLHEAFEAADRAMLQAKSSARTRLTA